MGGILGGSQKPKAPAVVQEPAVVIDDQQMAQDTEDARLRRRGRSSTVLASGQGLGGAGATATTQGTKTLLGQ